MKKRYYLGLNANGPRAMRTLFLHGTSGDLRALSEFLREKYQGAAVLTKNGRSALALALKAYFENGDKIIITGFTCYAVYEAVIAAGMIPIFADISKRDLNFNTETLEKLWHGSTARIRGIIIQNTLGNPVDIEAIEKFAKEHELLMIEDLAHAVGIKYYDGRVAGTVGVATVLSFGKDKAINAIAGGAVVFRAPQKHEIEAPSKAPLFSDHLRARFYPLLTAFCRGLNHLHMGGVMMRFFQKTHLVERSADNKLDLNRRLSKFEAKLALEQMKKLHQRGEPTLRDFYLVNERTELLKKLRQAGYFFDAFWYEKPVSPERYYKEVQFPEKNCPVAVKVANSIINLPKYYSKKELEPALELIKPHLMKEEDD